MDSWVLVQEFSYRCTTDMEEGMLFLSKGRSDVLVHGSGKAQQHHGQSDQPVPSLGDHKIAILALPSLLYFELCKCIIYIKKWNCCCCLKNSSVKLSLGWIGHPWRKEQSQPMLASQKGQQGYRKSQKAFLYFDFMVWVFTIIFISFQIAILAYTCDLKKINGENQTNWNCIGISLTSRSLGTVSEIHHWFTGELGALSLHQEVAVAASQGGLRVLASIQRG